MIKCFFLDRDGVLIKNYGYFHKEDKIKWLKGAINSIKYLNFKKIKVVVITNQSGVARGYFSEKQLKIFHQTMLNHLLKRKAKIDEIFYCPFHEHGVIKKYKKKSNLRKPDNGMLLKAMKQFKLHPSECVMIGDQRSDYLCAKKSKVYFEYKKKYALDIQVNNVLKKFNDK